MFNQTHSIRGLAIAAAVLTLPACSDDDDGGGSSGFPAVSGRIGNGYQVAQVPEPYGSLERESVGNDPDGSPVLTTFTPTEQTWSLDAEVAGATQVYSAALKYTSGNNEYVFRWQFLP